MWITYRDPREPWTKICGLVVCSAGAVTMVPLVRALARSELLRRRDDDSDLAELTELGPSGVQGDQTRRLLGSDLAMMETLDHHDAPFHGRAAPMLLDVLSPVTSPA